MLAFILLLVLQQAAYGERAQTLHRQQPPVTGTAATIQEGERRLLDVSAVPSEGPSEGSFVAQGWRIEATHNGDLNGDGRADVVLQLIENLPTETKEGTLNERYRALVILFRRRDGSFERAGVANRLLYCSTCAGVLGDPEGGNISVEIKNGVLNVSQLSGSREATDHTWRFRYDARLGRFVLIGEEVEHYDRAVGGGTSTSTNYLTGLRVTRKTVVRREGEEPRLVSTKRTRVSRAPRFIENVDYERR